MCDAGRLVEERDGFRLYECFIDGTFAKAKGGGDGIGKTKAGKGVKIMVLVDARGLPVAIDTCSASPHESQLVQRLFDFMLTAENPERIIGDKAYDSDKLDEELAEEGIELIAPHRSNRKLKNVHAGRPTAATLQTALDGGTHDRLDSALPPPVHSLGEVDHLVPGLPSSRMHHVAAQRGFGIGSSPRARKKVQHKRLGLA